MNLTEEDRHYLATQHGNAFEAREIRTRLAADGLKYCPACTEVKPLNAFAPNGPNALQSKCRLCSWKNRRSRIQYIPIGITKAGNAERSRRWRAIPSNRKLDRLRNRLQYWRRRASGMRGRVANWMESD